MSGTGLKQWFATTVGVLAAVAFVVVPAVRAQQTAPAPTGPLAPEKFKNIQVLTDVPADQLGMAMIYITAATGLQCQNCHVRDQATGEFAYEKDDQRAKGTAREMIKMVKGINAANYGITVSCATCHAGHNQPPGLQLAEMMTADQIAQAAAMAARQGGPSGPPRGGGAPGGGRGPQTPLPAVDDVLSKYTTAIGGEAALAKVASVALSGTMTARTTQTSTFTIQEKGAKYLETLKTEPGPSVHGFDGTEGWSQTGGHTAELSGFYLAQALRLSDPGRMLKLKALYPNLQPARTGAIDGKPMVAVRGSANGVTETFYFDAATGLLVRRRIQTATPLGQLPEQIDYSDYRDVSGVKLPYTIKRATWNMLDAYTVTTATINGPLDDSVFAKPRG